MRARKNALMELLFGAGRARRPRQLVLSCDSLEGRVTPSHFGVVHHAVAAVHHAAATTTTGTTGTTGTTNTALTTALQTLRNDAQTIELKSGVTVGELTAIRASFSALKTDGLTPTSQSALSAFEDSLVTANAAGTLAGSTTLLSQFEALYGTTLTTQQTTDLTAAYNALVAAVSSSNITSSDITTINADQAAVLTAAGSTSTATYPYFNLVTGQGNGHGGGGCH